LRGRGDSAISEGEFPTSVPAPGGRILIKVRKRGVIFPIIETREEKNVVWTSPEERKKDTKTAFLAQEPINY